MWGPQCRFIFRATEMDIYPRPSLKPRQKAVHRKSPAMPTRIHRLLFDYRLSLAAAPPLRSLRRVRFLYLAMSLYRTVDSPSSHVQREPLGSRSVGCENVF